MQVVFVGDIMLSGDQAGISPQLSSRLKHKFNNCDVRVATLETAIGFHNKIDEIKCHKSEVAVWSKQEDLHKLLDLNINVVSLANNHACDCGVDSMIQLIDTLRKLGITPIGGGCNAAEAMRPAVVEIDGEKLAIIGCCEDNPSSLGKLHYATDTQGGIYKLDEKVIISQIQELKKKYTYVAVVVHWGVEHKWLPENLNVIIAKKMIDAGADMILGGHPHHIQPQVLYKNRPIFYSLGNFHFPDFCLDSVSNVYYPDKEEFEKLPVFDWMAPGRRNFAMRYFWKYQGRLGMMAMCELDGKNVIAESCFSLYKKGKLSVSTIGWFHSMVLKLFAFYIGKSSSAKINRIISRTNYIIEYKLLSCFIKKYGFFNYLKKQDEKY